MKYAQAWIVVIVWPDGVMDGTLFGSSQLAEAYRKDRKEALKGQRVTIQIHTITQMVPEETP